MASALYEETYVDENVRRNMEQRSYEEINDYENEERTIGGPPSTPAMPPPQILRNPSQQDIEKSQEMIKYALKCHAAALVIVSVIFAGMFAAVFVMITPGREQGGRHKVNISDQSSHIGPWYKASNGLSYKLFNDKKAYDDAERNCQRAGARLVSTGIRLPTVRSEIWTNVMMSENTAAWLGLNQPYAGSWNYTWVWTDGAAYNKWNTPWGDSQPDDFGGGEDCVHMWADKTGEIKLYDKICNIPYAYICEKEL